MTSFLSFLFVIGVLVFVHELGHFLAARRIGVRVLTFSLGFGPKLLAFTRGDTEYCISAIPLGGYVKMAGENPEEARTGAPDEFLSKSKWQRFQVLVMGPVMNLALAWLVMAAVLYQGAQVPAFYNQPVVIGAVTPGSAAAKSGILAGDRIVAVDGEPVGKWEDFFVATVPKAKRAVTLDIERAGSKVQRLITPSVAWNFEEPWKSDALPIMHPVITGTAEGEPAQQGGLKPMDAVMAVAGERDVSSARLVELVKSHENQPLDLEVLRGGATLHVTVTPRKINDTVRIGAPISPDQVVIVEPGPIQALTMSAEQNWRATKLIVKTLGGLVTRKTSVKELQGPVGIGILSGEAAKLGWTPFFGLLAMISLNLGLLNLMPVPVLDGGHITILALEGLSRRDFSMKVKEKMLLGGFVLLLTLMVTVIYNDLMRIQWIERLVPWR